MVRFYSAPNKRFDLLTYISISISITMSDGSKSSSAAERVYLPLSMREVGVPPDYLFPNNVLYKSSSFI